MENLTFENIIKFIKLQKEKMIALHKALIEANNYLIENDIKPIDYEKYLKK